LETAATAPASTTKGKKGAAAAAAQLLLESSVSLSSSAATAVPPRVRTLEHGRSVVASREALLQERLILAELALPAPPSPPLHPLIPNDEHWHLVMSRTPLAATAAAAQGAVTTAAGGAGAAATAAPRDDEFALELSLGVHALLVVQQRSGSGAALERTYSFDGQEYRHAVVPLVDFSSTAAATPSVSGGGGVGEIDEASRLDGLVWSAARAWLDSDVLSPLGLPIGRRGWVLFFDELVPFESAGVHLQLLRSVYDAEVTESSVAQPLALYEAHMQAHATATHTATHTPRVPAQAHASPKLSGRRH